MPQNPANLSLAVTGLSKSYCGENPCGLQLVFSDINFSVKAGQCLVLFGPNGCGKSTLVRVVVGIESADAGQVMITEDNTRRAPTFLDFGLVFQTPRLLDWLTVEQNIMLPFRLGFRGQKDSASNKLKSLLTDYDLASVRDNLPSELSGGMQQKVAIARALITDPKILMLDEPFNNLDQQTHQSLVSLIKRLHRDEGRTVLVVTHDLEEAEDLGDCILHLSRRPAQIDEVEYRNHA